MPRDDTATRLRILNLLRDGAERYGLQLVDESGGEVPYQGLYSQLYTLEDLKLVISRPEPSPEAGRPARSLYRITGRGLEQLELHTKRAKSA